MTDNLDALRLYCISDAQRKVIDALALEGSMTKASKALSMDRRGVARTVKRVKKQAAARGYAPEFDMTKPTAQGYQVRGTSTLYDAETGEAKLQWVKTGKDQQTLEELQEAMLAAFEDVKPLPKVSQPKSLRKDLLTVYPMGDPHLGMYAWGKEAGEDFDIDIAASDLYAAVDRLVMISPDSETGVLLNLGDFFHADNYEGMTRRSGNVLDVDTRWPRVLDIGIQTMIRLIRRMLEKHKRVIVRNCIGNHDEQSSIMLSIALRCFFKDNNRVHIDTSPSPFWYYRHGKVLIGSTHGDRTKPADLPGIMATDKAKDWGETNHRFWYTGHIHNQKAFEFPGCLVQSFRTLAAKDAWHNAQGYRSGRDMKCIVHHSEWGEIESHRVGIEELHADKSKKAA